MASQYTATGYLASMPCYAWLFSEVIDFAYKLVGLLKILTQLGIDLVKMMFASLGRGLLGCRECKRTGTRMYQCHEKARLQGQIIASA